MEKENFTAAITQEANLYIAECLELGIISQGKSIQESLVNLEEATSLYLEEFDSPRLGTTFITSYKAEKKGAENYA